MKHRFDPERLEQAAAWRARLAESPELHSGEFSSWLAQDPRNREAWRRVQAPWDILGQQATAPGAISLRRAALAHAHNAIRGNFAWPRRLRRPALLAAAASAVIAAGAFLFWQQHDRPGDYRTGFGERRIVTLADGSQITLDSRSEVMVRYTADARALTLVQGQARFDVAHDVTRPFSVTADGHKVVATGTAFDVDLLGPKLLVTLLKGHVVVMQQSAPAIPWIPAATSRRAGAPVSSGAGSASGGDLDALGRIYLDPGEQLVMSSTGVPEVNHVDIERVTAWERGEIVFDNEPLASVVQRMNRYGPRRIVIGDERMGSLRISGVFHEGDVDGFVTTIAAYLSVRAQERPDGNVVLQTGS